MQWNNIENSLELDIFKIDVLLWYKTLGWNWVMLHIRNRGKLQQAKSHTESPNFKFFKSACSKLVKTEVIQKKWQMRKVTKTCTLPKYVGAMVLFVSAYIRHKRSESFFHNITVFFCSSTNLKEILTYFREKSFTNNQNLLDLVLKQDQ